MIYHDDTLANAGRYPPMTTRVTPRDYTAPGVCANPACGCQLSKYRATGDTLCAPCAHALEAQLRNSRDPRRFEIARRMLFRGASFADVARALGWANESTARRAIRRDEARCGLSPAGPKVGAKR